MPNMETVFQQTRTGVSLMFERICWCSVFVSDNIHCCRRLLDHLNTNILSDAPQLKSVTPAKCFLDMFL